MCAVVHLGHVGGRGHATRHLVDRVVQGQWRESAGSLPLTKLTFDSDNVTPV